jgi:hypothetical protein
VGLVGVTRGAVYSDGSVAGVYDGFGQAMVPRAITIHSFCG